jgi:hemolysin III
MSQTPIPVKPLLRGYFHQEAFFLFLGACALLVAKSTNERSLLSSLIYSLSLLLLFGISTLYHRVHWQTSPRALMRRLDHSAIFVQIAGTFTPICLLALTEEEGHKLLLIVWILAILGIMQSIFWVKAPKWFTSILYIAVGWMAFPYLSDLKVSLGFQNMILLAAGGILFTIGACFYALKKPNLFSPFFGYHELFHLFTLFGAGLHFIVIYQLIS